MVGIVEQPLPTGGCEFLEAMGQISANASSDSGSVWSPSTHQCLACDVACFVGGKEWSGVTNVCNMAQAFQRHRSCHRGQVILTDQCVSSTVRSLADESFGVVVVEDTCVATTDE